MKRCKVRFDSSGCWDRGRRPSGRGLLARASGDPVRHAQQRGPSAPARGLDAPLPPREVIRRQRPTDFDSLFTKDRPIIFNLPGYPWLIHRLAYRRTNHQNLQVRGYKERGNINTPLELAIENEIDCRNYAHEFGIANPRRRLDLAVLNSSRSEPHNGDAREHRRSRIGQ
jgi:hypothetical protein